MQNSKRNDRIACDLKQVNSTLHTLSLPTWLKLDVSMAQLKALVVVERAKAGVTVTGVGKALEIGEPSASLLVEQLVKRDYAVRTPDPTDRRRVLVTATDLGRELLGELRHGRRQHLDAWLARMEDDDVEALERGLAALAKIASADTQTV